MSIQPAQIIRFGMTNGFVMLKRNVYHISHGNGYSRGVIKHGGKYYVVKSTVRGWTVEHRLMPRLGYHRWFMETFPGKYS